jgi:hypothetical protein
MLKRTFQHPVMCKNSSGAFQGRLAVVQAQEPAKALSAYDRSRLVEIGRRQDELAAQALMVSLLVMYRNSIALVFTWVSTMERQSPPTRFRKAIGWASCIGGRDEPEVTQGVEETGKSHPFDTSARVRQGAPPQ